LGDGAGGKDDLQCLRKDLRGKGGPSAPSQCLPRRTRSACQIKEKPRREGHLACGVSSNTPALFPRGAPAWWVKGRRSLLRCRRFKCHIERDACLLAPRLMIRLSLQCPAPRWRGRYAACDNVFTSITCNFCPLVSGI
jgi:hypothetical protein